MLKDLVWFFRSAILGHWTCLCRPEPLSPPGPTRLSFLFKLPIFCIPALWSLSLSRFHGVLVSMVSPSIQQWLCFNLINALSCPPLLNLSLSLSIPSLLFPLQFLSFYLFVFYLFSPLFWSVFVSLHITVSASLSISFLWLSVDSLSLSLSLCVCVCVCLCVCPFFLHITSQFLDSFPKFVLPCLTLQLSVSPFTLSPHLSLSLSFSLRFSVSVFPSFSPFVSLTVSLNLSLSLFPHHLNSFLCLSLSLSPSFSHSLSLLLFLSLSLSLSPIQLTYVPPLRTTQLKSCVQFIISWGSRSPVTSRACTKQPDTYPSKPQLFSPSHFYLKATQLANRGFTRSLQQSSIQCSQKHSVYIHQGWLKWEGMSCWRFSAFSVLLSCIFFPPLSVSVSLFLCLSLSLSFWAKNSVMNTDFFFCLFHPLSLSLSLSLFVHLSSLLTPLSPSLPLSLPLSLSLSLSLSLCPSLLTPLSPSLPLSLLSLILFLSLSVSFSPSLLILSHDFCSIFSVFVAEEFRWFSSAFLSIACRR